MLPVSLATGPLGTLIQFHLMRLNGPSQGTIYASLAVAAFNGVSILAAIFWGYVTDRVHRRGAIIVMSYALTALILFAFFFFSTTPGTILVYSFFSFVSAAAATPLNLLIMETEQKGIWADAFARLSMFSSVGNVGGLVLSTVWANWLPLILLSFPLGALSLLSAILALVTIPEPAFVLERETIVRRRPSFFHRLLTFPLLFLTLPSLSDFRRLFRGLRFALTSYMPFFYISTVFFYLSSGLFNTVFVPALSTFSLSAGAIFAVILAGMVIQTLTFRFVGSYVERRSLVSSSISGLLLRGISYALLGVFAAFEAGPQFLIPALLLYPVASGVSFALYYTSSNTMMFHTIQTRHAGSALGVYSAVVGFATLAGSLASGFASVIFGFNVIFLLAAVLLVLAALILGKMPPAGAIEIP